MAAQALPLPLDGVLHCYLFFNAVLDVAPTLEHQIQGVRSTTHRRRLRRVLSSSDWEWSVADGPVALDAFWFGLHRPYLEGRFGPQARLDSLPRLQRRLAKGGRVLTVTHRGEVVCGAAIFDVPGGLDYDRNGFRLDTLKSRSKLAERTAALELALFQLAREASARTIELGFCRAFLNDGLFTHKRRLGCRFVPAPGTARYQLWVRPALRPAFFSSLPLVAGPCGAFEAHLGLWSQAGPLSAAELHASTKNFAVQAVRRAVVWTDVAAADPRCLGLEAALDRALGTRPHEVREILG